ncbi:unnamed protein product [Auanema sp. JU1783]|nr:unnamed protein product [Auanema sp. JU1783]
MKILVFLAIGIIAVSNAADVPSIVKRELKASPFISKKTETVEGSGDAKSLSAHPDMEVHGSGYGSDDEDGDDVQGSGDSKSDLYEGSGRPELSERPQVSTTSTTTATPFAVKSTTTTTHSVLNPIKKYDDNEDTSSVNQELPGINVLETREEVTITTTTTTLKPTTIAPNDSATLYPFHSMLKPGIFAAVIGGTVVGLLTAVLLVMFIIHRMRKKDEGSYALDEPKPRPYAGYAYTKASTKEFYA